MIQKLLDLNGASDTVTEPAELPTATDPETAEKPANKDSKSCESIPTVEQTELVIEVPCNFENNEIELIKPVLESTPEPAPQERRLSARLSAAHLKKAELVASKIPKPSSLPVRPSSLSQKFYSRPSQTKPVDKENTRPAARFNKDITHIPTLQERVAALAATKRQSLNQPNEAPVKRAKFDLKESLKKPLGYKPYSGPLDKKL